MGWLERQRGTLAALVVVLVAVAAFAVLQVPRRPALQVVSPASSPTPVAIKVHVVGAVLSPGVYQLAADARAGDAVDAAGGPSSAADLVAMNLAVPLRDGQQVVVPERGTAAIAAQVTPVPASSQPQAAGKLNLNTASRQELEALPGIGPVTAQKLLDYRQTRGAFVSVDELKDAKLVNSSTFEKVKGLVEVR
ncbi:MAG TPA: helix-hairpin-helix domain-containing protein [Chloroflexota bacterium]